MEELEHRQIRMRERDPSAEVLRRNPWYTDDQVEAAQGHQSLTIERRVKFIRQSVHEYLTAHANKSMYILDAGCGDGVQLKVLTGLSGKGVWGIDYNLLRTRRARQNVPAANVVCGDLIHLPFRAGTFDLIVCSQVIEHIPQDTKLLKTLASVLRRQGFLILGTPNEGCLMARMRNHLLEPTISKTSDHAHFYTEAVIRQKIEAAGFFVVQVMRENWFFPLQKLNHYFSTRGWGIRLMARLNKVIPSQTAGYYFRCVKSG